MAGDWIKMRADLFTHPKVIRISSALKADTLRTVGGLMSAWCLFDAHSVDGILEGYRPETLDDHLRWPGFASAMMAVRWLSDDGESLVLPEFDTHNGQSAKRRAQDADRKQAVRKMSAADADKTRTREEKRREENKEQQQPPKADAPSAKRGQRLAPDWEPSDADVDFAVQRRVNWREELETFRDHWASKSGADACKLDWSATWRNWIRRSRQNVKTVPQAPVKSKTLQAVERLGRMANAVDGEGDWFGSGEAAVSAPRRLSFGRHGGSDGSGVD
jgi:hypothetical protein